MYVRTKREWTKENTDNSLVAGRNLAGGGRGNGNRTSWFPGWVTGGEAARAISLLEADVLVQSMNHTGLKKNQKPTKPESLGSAICWPRDSGHAKEPPEPWCPDL